MIRGKWFGPKDEKDSKGDKDKKNENLDEYSDDGNENTEEEDNSGLRKTEKAAIDPDGYMAFKMPWSLSLSYSYSIREDRSKQINIKTMRYPYSVTHSLNVSGNVKLGSRWNVNYSSGYDFNTKEMSMTTVNISRDLHCFNMSCGLVFGPFTSYNFSIRANSSMLTDALKWDQRSNTGSAVIGTRKKLGIKNEKWFLITTRNHFSFLFCFLFMSTTQSVFARALANIRWYG